MTPVPVHVQLGDAALVQQVARWLDDERIGVRLTSAGLTADEASGPPSEPTISLTDVGTLRAGTLRPMDPAVDEGTPTRHALIVLGASTSWSDRALAAAHGATQFVGLPPSRKALIAAVHAARDLQKAPSADVLLLAQRDAATAQAAEALTTAGLEVHVESDPQRLFERLHFLKPEVLVVLPEVSGVSAPQLLRMIRSDLRWDDMMLVTVVSDSAMVADLPSGASALIGPIAPDVLARAVSERARRRRALAKLPSLHPMLALQDQERRALDAHALVSITDHRGNIVYVNDHFCQTSGYRRDELLGRNHRIVKSGMHPAEVYAAMWRTISEGSIWQGELCNRSKDGSLYWVATTIMPVGDADSGIRRYLSIRTDITGAKEVQFSLRRRVRQQRALAAVSRRLAGSDRAMLLRLAPAVLRLACRLVGAIRVQWSLRAGQGGDSVVAEWPVPGAGTRGPGAGAAARLVTPAGPEAGPAGRIAWWLGRQQASLKGSDEAFVHALASALGSAWQRTAADLSRRASEQALTDMLSAFPGIAAAVGEDMTYEFANEPYARLYGLRPEQVVGRRHADVGGAADEEQIRHRRELILSNRQPLTLQESMQVPGESEPRDFSIVHFFTGGREGAPRRFFQIGIDVTERRRMEGRLERLLAQSRSEARLQRLIAALAMELGAASAVTLDGLLEGLLRDVGRFFEVDRAGLVFLSLDGSTVSDAREWCADGVASAKPAVVDLSIDAFPWTRRQLLDERAPVHVPDVDALPSEAASERTAWRRLGLRSAVSVPILAGGRTIGFMVFAAVRQRMHWSDAAIDGLGILGQIVANTLHRVQTEKALMALKDQAEAASVAKSEFLASMSHELRTPMNAVLGFGQLLELSLQKSPREQSYVQEMLKGGRHLLTLIDDVLDLARVESGRIDFSPEPIALADVGEDCQRLMQPLAQHRRIQLTLDMGAHAMLADRVRLKQVLVNLMSNAIKYNVEGGRVEVTAADADEGWVRVAVRDTGPGIAIERQHELFQPFNRLGAEAGAIEGTGIGLALVRRLVGLMGGRVGVASAPGQGSTFWFELPAPPSGVESAMPIARESVFGGLQSTSDKRVLYIDDNPPNLRLMENILARWPGVTLLTAQHPHLGLELAQAHRPHVVLLDIQMAPLDGYQVLRQLRHQPDLANVPVVAITANAMPRDVARARAAGFDECLTKPFDVRALLAVLDRHLHPSPAAQHLGTLTP